MKSVQIKYLIIGAGPTGLGAAYRLQEMGIDDYLILEKESHPGGLSASFVDDRGFTWDIGGHVLFSHYKYFDEVMDKALGSDGWIHHNRESWIWIEDRFVPYPFQYNIRYLSDKTRDKCLEGLREIKPGAKSPKNFKEWILASFGKGLAEVFMLPYNYKVWAYQPEVMDYHWVGDRVAIVDLERVEKNIREGKDDVSWGPNNRFRFPKQGGTGAIWNGVAKLLKKDNVLYRTGISKVDHSSKTVIDEKGNSYKYDVLVNTMSVDMFVGMCDELPPWMRDKANKLEYSSTHVLGVGLKGQPPEELKTKCWMYFPESNCPFYRVTVFSNYSPGNVPDANNTWSLMAEVSESAAKKVEKEKVREEIIEGLLNTKLIASKEEIGTEWYFKTIRGYPTPTLNRDEMIDPLILGFEKYDIYSRGRHGAWKYEVGNQDHSFMQGVELIERLVNGNKEKTYHLGD